MISKLRKQWREDIAAAVADLRADLNVQIGVARGEIKQLRGKANAA